MTCRLRAVLAVAVASVVTSAAPAVGATPFPDPLAHPRAFADPPAAARPMMRWWWGDLPFVPQAFADEVHAMAQAGFGGVEAAFGAALGGGTGWGNAEQRAALRATLEQARRDGISVDMTIGAAWPITTPNTKPGSGLSEQELMYGRLDVQGPAPYAGPVPHPLDDPTGMQKGGHLVAVTAARVLSAGDPVLNAGTAPLRSTILDPRSLVDLTPKLGPNGTVTWDVPPGHWILFGFWQRDSSEGVMDHLSLDSLHAAAAYVDENQIGADTAALLPGVGGAFFEDSLELDANELWWTPRFATDFRARRGYALAKFLPLAFVEGEDHYWVPDKRPVPDFDTPDATADRVRHDVEETFTDLYIDRHLAGWIPWARSHGMRYRTQAAFGDAFDVTRSARAVARLGGLADDESLNAGDIPPLGEANANWRFAADHYRSVVAGAHQGGQNQVSSELGAVFGRDRMMGLPEYKAIMDKQWAFGLARPIVHGYAHQAPGAAWPGTDHFSGLVAESWNRGYPQWSMWRPLTDYWARGNLVLEHGAPRTDVAVYRDGFVTTAATTLGIANGLLVNQVEGSLPTDALNGTLNGLEATVDPRPTPFFDGAGLERAGYGYEYLDPGGLTDPAVLGRGTLYPDGPAYRALVVDARALPGAAAQAIARAAEHGVAVVLVGGLPTRGTSLGAAPAEDAEVADAVARLLRSPHVRRVTGDAEVLAALHALGVQPRASWSRPVHVYAQQRHTRDLDTYYLFNAASTAATLTASLQTRGVPYRLDLWTGAIDRVPLYRAAGGRIAVPLTLGPGETTVLAVRRRRTAARAHVVQTSAQDLVARGAARVEVQDTRGGAQTVQLSTGVTRTVTLPAAPQPLTPRAWHLHVDAVGRGGTSSRDVDLAALADWREIPGLELASGTGTYTAHVTVPAGWQGTRLELGRVDGAMQASVNGVRVAPDVVPDRAFDITALLHPGDNELRVVVTTTPKNAVVAACRAGDLAGQATLCAQPATQPYGLRGPVRLVPYSAATVRLPRVASRR